MRTKTPIRNLAGWVRILDAGLADAPARVCAEARVASPGAETRIGFQLEVATPLRPDGRYVVRAELAGVGASGRPQRFGTTQSYPWSPTAGPTDMILFLDPW